MNDAKKTPNRREHIQVNFRLDDAEFDRLKRNADTLSMTVSAYAKFRTKTSGDVTVRFSHEDAVLFLKELGRIGTNLNQIARFCNQQESGLSVDVAERLISSLENVQKGIDDLWRQLS